MLVPSQGSQEGRELPLKQEDCTSEADFWQDLKNCMCGHLLYQALHCEVFISTDDEQCPHHPPSIFPPKSGGPEQCQGHWPAWAGVTGVALPKGGAASWGLLPGSLRRCGVKAPPAQGPLLQSLWECRGEKWCWLRPFYQFWVVALSLHAPFLLSH